MALPRISAPPYDVPLVDIEGPHAGKITPLWHDWHRQVADALKALYASVPVSSTFTGSFTGSPYTQSLTIITTKVAKLLVVGSIVQNQSVAGQTWEAVLVVDATTIFDSGAGQPFQAAASIAGEIIVNPGSHTITLTWLQSASPNMALKYVEFIVIPVFQ